MTNLLAQETSPYLRQHAANPVAWYPWGPEALERARREDKPILLSIGYSSCHWCHVMAHESFEDAATAAVMNAHYINIKVDREERPDLDKIYQTAHQLLTGRGGGWPLTMFLMPDDHTPFFAGTYFPPQPRHGLPAFVDVLEGIARFYRERRAELAEQNNTLRAALAAPAASSAGVLTDAPLKKARELLEKSYDAEHGGFGRAPKFPHPGNIDRLLRDGAAGDRTARAMALHTLRAMAAGGIYDHLGGGFCRYSVDERWMIPHFEKMLYDNGLLLALYADAWCVHPDETFKCTALQTAEWVTREMQMPEGGYYSTLDADSEHEEGKFYVWTPKEVRAILKDPSQYELFARHYGLHQPANFEGHWHLRVVDTVDEMALATGASEAQIERELADARAQLFAVREQRVRPGRDEKILTSWNGLMIKGMARAGRVFGRDDFIRSAERALDFVRSTLWRDGRLHAACTDGQVRLNAYLDDYAFLIDAILELLQARWRAEDLRFARELAELLLVQFEDHDAGGFFFTSHDHERLVHRPKTFNDDALPSGNGVAARVLLQLGSLFNEARYLRAAERTLRAGWEELLQYPHACDALLAALDEWLAPGQTVVVRGAPEATAPLVARATRDYAPRRTVYSIEPGVNDLPPGLAPYVATAAPVTAYVCTGTQCAPPATSVAELNAVLLPPR